MQADASLGTRRHLLPSGQRFTEHSVQCLAHLGQISRHCAHTQTMLSRFLVSMNKTYLTIPYKCKRESQSLTQHDHGLEKQIKKNQQKKNLSVHRMHPRAYVLISNSDCLWVSAGIAWGNWLEKLPSTCREMAHCCLTEAVSQTKQWDCLRMGYESHFDHFMMTSPTVIQSKFTY